MATDFGRIISGARGTIVLGRGVLAVTGEVEEVYADGSVCVIQDRTGDRIVVPVGSIVYFRFEKNEVEAHLRDEAEGEGGEAHVVC